MGENKLGELIRAARLRMGWTLAQAKEPLGYSSVGGLASVETGRATPKPEDLPTFSEVLAIPLADLVAALPEPLRSKVYRLRGERIDRDIDPDEGATGYCPGVARFLRESQAEMERNQLPLPMAFSARVLDMAARLARGGGEQSNIWFLRKWKEVWHDMRIEVLELLSGHQLDEDEDVERLSRMVALAGELMAEAARRAKPQRGFREGDDPGGVVPVKASIRRRIVDTTQRPKPE